MGDFDKIKLDVNQRDLSAEKKKVLNNDFREKSLGNAFSVFIEQAIAKSEEATDGQNDYQKNSKETIKPEMVTSQVDEKDISNKNNISNDADKRMDTEKARGLSKAVPKEVKKQELENLREALTMAGKKLEQFLYILPDSSIQVKKADAVSKINKASSISIDTLIDELVQQIKKVKVGNLNKLSITLKPDGLGEMEIFFTISEEDRVKKVFISFAGQEDALTLIKSNQQELESQLSGNGHFLGGMDFVLYGGSDHQKSRESKESELSSVAFVNDLLKSDNKQDIINKVDSYVADLIVNYIA